MKSNRNLAIVAAVVVALALAQPAAAQVVQTPIKTNKIPQFVDPLPLLVTGIPIVDGTTPAMISICEFQTEILPAGSLGKNTPAPKTWVWGYQIGDTCLPDPGHSYIGPVVVAERGTPTNLTFINQLPNADPYSMGLPNPSNVLAFTQNTDQTMHWADPLNFQNNGCSHALSEGYLVPSPDCQLNYTGPVAAAVHLHGGEVPPDLDGGPDSWWTPDGDYRGHGYYTREVAELPDLDLPANQAEFRAGVLVYNQNLDGVGEAAGYYLSQGTAWSADPNIDRATYVYPNTQEAANIWFHDHVLGMTRLNVYAGIAGAYVITDDANVNAALHNPAELVPLVIQDRMFDTNGQLFFGAGGTTPEHPWWIPEFIGDVIVVNGKAWPYLNVEAKKYRFLFLNGSNARAYEVRLKDITNDLPAPSMWVIGTDGGFLDTPALIDNNAMPPQKLVVMPGERYEVVIDFSNVAAGTILRMENTAGTPFPFGEKVNGSTTKRVMEFRVVADPALVAATATEFDPATMSPSLHPIEPLGGLTPLVRRQLTLNEIVSPLTGTPLEALLNNTKWNGLQVIEDGRWNSPRLSRPHLLLRAAGRGNRRTLGDHQHHGRRPPDPPPLGPVSDPRAPAHRPGVLQRHLQHRLSGGPLRPGIWAAERLQHRQHGRRRRWQPCGVAMFRRSAPAAGELRKRLERHRGRVPRSGDQDRGAVGAHRHPEHGDRHHPARLSLRPEPRSRLRLALPHPRPRGQRDDAADRGLDQRLVRRAPNLREGHRLLTSLSIIIDPGEGRARGPLLFRLRVALPGGRSQTELTVRFAHLQHRQCSK
jgi:FtsP/CotA-like multicopper oxidase with cupredoxin domain